MKQTYLWGRVLAGAIAVYHIVIGLALLLSGELALKLARQLDGLTIEGTPQLGIVGEIFGCYLLAFGLMMVFVVIKPVKNRSLISVALALFALRLLQRIVFASKTMAILGLSPAEYWPMAVVVAAFALALALLRGQIARDLRHSTPSVA
jgi:hypothetical protein